MVSALVGIVRNWVGCCEMINPAILCVPAMAASNAVRRQQASNHHGYSEPIPDRVDREAREARKRYAEYYVDELQKAGFEVWTCEDVIDDRTIIKVRKGDIMYCTSVDNVYFMDDLCLTYEIRHLVRRVENAIAEKEKEKTNDQGR